MGYWNTTGQVFYSADAGAVAGPIVSLYRNSATPAASDIIGQVLYQGEDSAGNTEDYASVEATILDPTSTSEDAKLGFSTVVAGTKAERGYIGQGLVIGAPTGGDKGAGSANFESVYVSNVVLAPSFAVPGAIGLIIVNNTGTPNTIIDLDADLIVMANSSNVTLAASSANVSINAGTVGAHGIDAGSLANNTWYYVYGITDGTTFAGLLSASATSPTMPGSYTYKVRLGAVKTGGSATFLRTIQRGMRAQYQVIAASTTPNMPIMVSGTAGDVSVPTYISIATGAYVPTTATQITYTIGGQGVVIVAPNTSYGAFNSTANPVYDGINGGTDTPAIRNAGSMLLETTNIYWASNGAAGFLTCNGWIDNVNAS